MDLPSGPLSLRCSTSRVGRLGLLYSGKVDDDEDTLLKTFRLTDVESLQHRFTYSQSRQDATKKKDTYMIYSIVQKYSSFLNIETGNSAELR